jgi:hypothetical protein
MVYELKLKLKIKSDFNAVTSISGMPKIAIRLKNSSSRYSNISSSLNPSPSRKSITRSSLIHRSAPL